MRKATTSVAMLALTAALCGFALTSAGCRTTDDSASEYPSSDADHPQGEHPNGEHPTSDHPDSDHPE